MNESERSTEAGRTGWVSLPFHQCLIPVFYSLTALFNKVCFISLLRAKVWALMHNFHLNVSPPWIGANRGPQFYRVTSDLHRTKQWLNATNSSQVVWQVFQQKAPRYDSGYRIDSPSVRISLRSVEQREKQKDRPDANILSMCCDQCIHCYYFILLSFVSLIVFTFETIGFYTEFLHMLCQFAKTLVMASQLS